MASVTRASGRPEAAHTAVSSLVILRLAEHGRPRDTRWPGVGVCGPTEWVGGGGDIGYVGPNLVESLPA